MTKIAKPKCDDCDSGAVVEDSNEVDSNVDQNKNHTDENSENTSTQVGESNNSDEEDNISSEKTSVFVTNMVKPAIGSSTDLINDIAREIILDLVLPAVEEEILKIEARKIDA